MTVTLPPQRRLGVEIASPLNLNRRGFLGVAAGACSLLLINRAAAAAPVSLLPPRRLFITQPLAGESFKGEYFAQGRYIPDALARIQRLLRDVNDNTLHQIDPELINLMARMQRTLATTESLQIVSGYRSPLSNARARRTDRRVAKNSFHMQGKAVDIRVAGYSLGQMRRAALSLEAGGVGTYARRDFLHIDVGPVRNWG